MVASSAATIVADDSADNPRWRDTPAMRRGHRQGYGPRLPQGAAVTPAPGPAAARPVMPKRAGAAGTEVHTTPTVSSAEVSDHRRLPCLRLVFIDALMVKVRDWVVANRPVYLPIGVDCRPRRVRRPVERSLPGDRAVVADALGAVHPVPGLPRNASSPDTTPLDQASAPASDPPSNVSDDRHRAQLTRGRLVRSTDPRRTGGCVDVDRCSQRRSDHDRSPPWSAVTTGRRQRCRALPADRTMTLP